MSGLDDQLRDLGRFEISPEDRALFDEGTKLYADGKVDDAIPKLEGFILRATYNAGELESAARVCLADCYETKGQNERALSQLNIALECFDGERTTEAAKYVARTREQFLEQHPELRPKNL